jgi:hypothetical protein
MGDGSAMALPLWPGSEQPKAGAVGSSRGFWPQFSLFIDTFTLTVISVSCFPQRSSTTNVPNCPNTTITEITSRILTAKYHSYATIMNLIVKFASFHCQKEWSLRQMT